ncbi:MAG TPA: carbohydrate ABC transporter permease [Chloroflexi bacterium]|jgi:multiple sugar transport system permease protein|nr:carbohydrate ABC transporter permease [Chloroflexota bacterium]
MAEIALGGRGTAQFGRTMSQQRRLSRTLMYVLMLFLLALFGFPLYYMVIASLMTQAESYAWPPLLYPKSWVFANYPDMLSRVPFVQWFWNTVVIAFFQVLGATASSTVVAYGFARFRFPGRGVLFLITLGTMMFPGQITLIPQFIMFHRLGWLNTFYPLIVPSFFGGGAFNIFLMRQFIMQLPREFDEAALIDGASYLRTFVSVLMPLIKPAVATVAIIVFMNSWNLFLEPLIYLTSNKYFTLAVGLRFWDAQPAQGELTLTHLMMAMCVLTAAPCIVLFFAAQRVFVRGIVMSGIKG